MVSMGLGWPPSSDENRAGCHFQLRTGGRASGEARFTLSGGYPDGGGPEFQSLYEFQWRN